MQLKVVMISVNLLDQIAKHAKHFKAVCGVMPKIFAPTHQLPPARLQLTVLIVINM